MSYEDGKNGVEESLLEKDPEEAAQEAARIQATFQKMCICFAMTMGTVTTVIAFAGADFASIGNYSTGILSPSESRTVMLVCVRSSRVVAGHTKSRFHFTEVVRYCSGVILSTAEGARNGFLVAIPASSKLRRRTAAGPATSTDRSQQGQGNCRKTTVSPISDGYKLCALAAL
jgi:hypothetical protein